MLYDYKERIDFYGLVWFHEGKIGQALVLWEVCIFYYTKGGKGIGVGYAESWIMARFTESDQALVNISGGNLSSCHIFGSDQGDRHPLIETYRHQSSANSMPFCRIKPFR